MAVRLGHAQIVVTHPRVLAADPAHDTLFAARAALKRALAVRRDAELQVDQMRALVGRLEAAATDDLRRA